MNCDVAEVILESERSVVNVAPSIMTPPLTEYGACSGTRWRIEALLVGQQYLRNMVVGYRVRKRRELGRVGSGEGGRSD